MSFIQSVLNFSKLYCTPPPERISPVLSSSKGLALAYKKLISTPAGISATDTCVLSPHFFNKVE